MLPVLRERRTREGGAARDSKNKPEKKGTVPLASELPEENAETCLGQYGTICQPSAEDHANLRGGRMERRKIHGNRPLTAKNR
jgi:hypothetical protein